MKLKTNASKGKGFIKSLRSEKSGQFNKVNFGRPGEESARPAGRAEDENYGRMFARGERGNTNLGRYTDEKYVNPNTSLKHANIPGEHLDYDRHGTPINGHAETYAGASLQVPDLERVVKAEGEENPLVIEEVAPSEYELPEQDDREGEQAPQTLRETI